LQEINSAPLHQSPAHEQSVFDSRIVAIKGRKGEDKKLAVLTYLGANADLKSYRAKFGDGSSTLLSPTEVKRRLMPEGTTLSGLSGSQAIRIALFLLLLLVNIGTSQHLAGIYCSINMTAASCL